MANIASLSTAATATPPKEMVPGDLATAQACGARITEALALLK